MSFKIEKDVPLPGGVRRRPNKYPWREMEIGDSFFIPGEGKKHLTAISATATTAGRRLALRFVCRAAEGGVRVWRIE